MSIDLVRVYLASELGSVFSVYSNHATLCISSVEYMRSYQRLKCWPEKNSILEMSGKGLA